MECGGGERVEGSVVVVSNDHGRQDVLLLGLLGAAHGDLLDVDTPRQKQLCAAEVIGFGLKV